MFYKYQIKLVKEMELNEEITIPTPSIGVKIINEFFDLSSETQECLCMISFDTKGKVVGVSNVSRGTQRTCIFDVKDILKRALITNASAIMLFHNHPSGDVTPSKLDRECTQMIKKACDLLDIILIDHVIIGENTHYSFKGKGEI